MRWKREMNCGLTCENDPTTWLSFYSISFREYPKNVWGKIYSTALDHSIFTQLSLLSLLMHLIVVFPAKMFSVAFQSTSPPFSILLDRDQRPGAREFFAIVTDSHLNRTTERDPLNSGRGMFTSDQRNKSQKTDPTQVFSISTKHRQRAKLHLQHNKQLRDYYI